MFNSLMLIIMLTLLQASEAACPWGMGQDNAHRSHAASLRRLSSPKKKVKKGRKDPSVNGTKKPKKGALLVPVVHDPMITVTKDEMKSAELASKKQQITALEDVIQKLDNELKVENDKVNSLELKQQGFDKMQSQIDLVEEELESAKQRLQSLSEEKIKLQQALADKEKENETMRKDSYANKLLMDQMKTKNESELSVSKTSSRPIHSNWIVMIIIGAMAFVSMMFIVFFVRFWCYNERKYSRDTAVMKGVQRTKKSSAPRV